MTDRLDPGVFDLPLAEIRSGYRSAVYFNRTRAILEAERPAEKVTMQVFQKDDSVLCGMDEALAILQLCTGRFDDADKAREVFGDYLKAKRSARTLDFGYRAAALAHAAVLEAELDRMWVSYWGDLEVHALRDGDLIKPWEPVLTIRGPLWQFAHLESVYLGVLARRTRVATNTRRVVRAANGKPLLFFADRFDHFATQGGDGYAAHIGGATGFATDAMGAWWGESGMGTMPHALIAAYHGDVVEANRAFHDHFPEANLIALVDFSNDCVGDSLRCLREFGKDLWGVRLDTSENMVDVSIAREDMGDFRPTGVNPRLVGKVRDALDDNGGSHVKIVVSGGFTADKITDFEEAGVPVDSYAVGSSLLKGGADFTADVVNPVAKAGRRQRVDSRLTRVSPEG